MTSCERVLAKLEVYLDGELGDLEVDRLVEHLKDCPECLEQEMFLSKLRAIIRRKLRSEPQLPAVLVDRLRHSITAAVGR